MLNAENDLDAGARVQCEPEKQSNHTMPEQYDWQTVTAAGDVIASRYVFIEKLGEGGMGSVFKAHDKLLGRSVAVKILNVSTVAQEDIVRFHKEAKAASNIVHPNVIKVLDFGITESGQPYMVMEFVNGRNLHDLIKTKGALPMMLSRIPNLHILSLRGCNMDRKKMEALATLPKLTVLYLNDNSKVLPKDLEPVLQHKSLFYVNVRNTASSYMPKVLNELQTKYKKTIATDPPQFNTEAFIETMSFAAPRRN